ncbi:MAG: hypothetical protein H7308_12080 [Chthonomonadaceae bacterium]|nr:hypothetical protein [Chthonomonadaceae bacterium]
MFFEKGSGGKLFALTELEHAFSPSEREFLTEVYNYFAPLTSQEISALSHEEEGYLKTKERQSPNPTPTH